MPGMDGVQLTRMIREDVLSHKIRNMPVVIMVTAFSKDQLLREAQGVLLDGLLVKPVMPSALLDTITGLRGRKVDKLVETSRPQFEEQSAPLRGAHVLLVDDHEINRMVAREFLENSGLRVSEAQNGQECVEAVLNGKFGTFDAVLMDLQMPVMDGFEAARAIRSKPLFQDLPIIAMTAAVMEQDREACRVAGMNDHVAKPILPQALMETLSRWIKPGVRAASPGAAEKRVNEAPELPLELPGFDFKPVLALLGGNRAMLKKLLIQFGEKFADAEDKLARLVQAGELAPSAALVHNIMGAAGNLGAIELFGTAKRLEAELATGGSCHAMEEFNRTLASVLAAIASIAKPGGTTGLPGAECDQCNWRSATELFQQLRTLLEGDDYVPHELMAELRAAIPCESMRLQLRKIEKFVGEFNYAQARSVLAELNCIVGYRFQEGHHGN